jgi:peptidoglycan/xylan/chitin deacetylase (PgdA/CDA1 family)
MTESWILMYHRVCPREPPNECWFARGTAVTPAAFALQLAWLRDRYDFVPIRELSAARPTGSRPRVSLTFDDGYAEVLDVVEPICRRAGVTGTCFCSAGPAFLGAPFWFDSWYACVQAGPPAALRACVERWGTGLPRTLDEWVSGPTKRWLATLPPQDRAARIAELVAATGTDAGSDLYLTIEQIRELRRRGWDVGGHGSLHVRLTDCSAAERAREVEESRRLLDRVGQRAPRVFAYADGAWDGPVAERVRDAGFELACTVEPGAIVPGTPPLALPRLFCRGEGAVPHPALAPASSGAP